MKRNGLTLLMLILSLGIACGQDEKITIGAGNTVGLYYASGSAVAKFFNLKRQEYGQYVVTRASNGSVENIQEVLEGAVDFGLAQSGMIESAIRGTRQWEGSPNTNLQAVLTLYTELFTIVTAADAEIYTLSDLKGKRINIGAQGSSDAANAREILEMEGVRWSEVTILEEPESMSSDLLEDGKIDAYVFTVGHPSFSIREASAGERKVRLASLSEPLIEFYLEASPMLKSVTLQTEYYPELVNDEPVRTLGVPAVLFTRADMPEETVYRMVKEVMTNLDLFRKQQPALKHLEAKGMADSMTLPLHPGAERYFRETGLLQ